MGESRVDPADSTLVELVDRRATVTPQAMAYRFLRDDLTVADELTYGGLAARARAIGGRLRECAEPGDRALMLYPPGLDFLCAFLGCLHAGVIAVPAYPPRGHELDARVRSIAADAAPRIGLAPAAIVPVITAAAGPSDLAGLPWLGTDEVDPSGASAWTRSRSGVRHPASTPDPGPRTPDDRRDWCPAPDTVAHLQYTSGSTAAPRGVVVTHRNLLRNLLDMHTGWRHDEASVLLSWLPHFHDMGLVYGLLGPLFAGVPGYLMAPLTFIQRPRTWLQAISAFGVTHSVAPNFAYDLCVRKIKPADREALDLSRWRVAVNGAEPVRARTLERFTATFAPCGFRADVFCPGFGLAEATLKVTASHAGDPPCVFEVDADALDRGSVRADPAPGARVRTLVGCGWTDIDTEVLIVDPATRLACPVDRVGEVWVGGTTVARGYWQRPEESAATFGATLADSGRGPFMRTGDLGFVRAGELFITGRIKEMLIIRGQNYYPQDIELTVEGCHAAFRQNGCAAFAVEIDGEERLVVAVELEREARAVDYGTLAGLVQQAVAEVYEIGVYDTVWLRSNALPRTSSGKIQRHACRLAYPDGLRGRLSGGTS